ncbi:MAG: hypothetical protein AAF170_12735 [Bacteroidota bacterium]
MRFGFLVFLFAFVATDALAQVQMRRSGTLQRVDSQISVTTGQASARPVSGRPGTRVHSLNPGNNAILSKLFVGAQNGRVCYVQAHFWRKSSPVGQRQEFRRRFDQCTPQIGRTPQVGEVRFFMIGQIGDEIYSGDKFRASRGLQTCAFDDAPRLNDRSLSLFETEIDRQGTFTPQDNVTAAVWGGSSTECLNNRNTASMCPSGQVVVGVNVHYRPRRSITPTIGMGLAPICAPITVQ